MLRRSLPFQPTLLADSQLCQHHSSVGSECHKASHRHRFTLGPSTVSLNTSSSSSASSSSASTSYSFANVGSKVSQSKSQTQPNVERYIVKQCGVSASPTSRAPFRTLVSRVARAIAAPAPRTLNIPTHRCRSFGVAQRQSTSGGRRWSLSFNSGALTNFTLLFRFLLGREHQYFAHV
jgi:hypothetical protein